jgi:hypothetical protein
MPLAKIHVVEGRYDEARIGKVSAAIQAALMNTLRMPPEDFSARHDPISGAFGLGTRPCGPALDSRVGLHSPRRSSYCRVFG